MLHPIIPSTTHQRCFSDGLLGSAESADKVAWRRGYSSWGNNSEALRKSLRAKYRKYTSSPDSLGETPLIVAIFAEMTLRSEMEEALYGQIEQKIILRRVPTPVIEPRIKRVCDGVWFNSKNGTPGTPAPPPGGGVVLPIHERGPREALPVPQPVPEGIGLRRTRANPVRQCVQTGITADNWIAASTGSYDGPTAAGSTGTILQVEHRCENPGLFSSTIM